MRFFKFRDKIFKNNLKNNFSLCLCAVLVCSVFLFLFVFSERADSDFGNFSGTNDYGGGGHSSHSSSGGHSYSSGGGNFSYSSESNIDLSPLLGALYLDDVCGNDSASAGIGFIFIAFIVWKFIKSLIEQYRHKYDFEYPDEQNAQMQGAVPVSQNILSPIENYINLDANFDETKLREHLANLYVQMQDAWHKKDIRSLRPWFADAFYNQMDRQLDEFRKQRRTDYTEHIAVLDVNFAGYYQRGGMDYLVARIKTRIVSYVLDDRTGELVSGDMKREKFMEYEYELIRKSGVLTQAQGDGMQTAACPHCGAPLSVNASAQCEYCGSVITATNETWAIRSIKGISQRTV